MLPIFINDSILKNFSIKLFNFLQARPPFCVCPISSYGFVFHDSTGLHCFYKKETASKDRGSFKIREDWLIGRVRGGIGEPRSPGPTSRSMFAAG